MSNDYSELFKKYSLYNEDRIISFIFQKIQIYNKFFIELGNNGNKNGSNTAYFREEYGGNGLLFDHDEDYHGHFHGKKDYDSNHEFIIAENINELFKKYNVPNIFDLLSIHIDGQDYWIINNLDILKFKPRVICIQININIPYDIKIVQKNNPHFIKNNDYEYGCSISAICELLNNKNFTLVSITGNICIFIENTVLHDKNIHFTNSNNIVELLKINEHYIKNENNLNNINPNNDFWLKLD
jgi:hypothetical protein